MKLKYDKRRLIIKGKEGKDYRMYYNGKEGRKEVKLKPKSRQCPNSSEWSETRLNFKSQTRPTPLNWPQAQRHVDFNFAIRFT